MPVPILGDKVKIAIGMVQACVGGADRIDRGGTFTDCIAIPEHGPSFVVKLLSVDPGNYRVSLENDCTDEGADS
jgi:hypothetical protein